MIANIINYRNFSIFYLFKFKLNKYSHLIVCRFIKCVMNVVMNVEMNVEMNFSWDNVSRTFVTYDFYVRFRHTI